MTKATRMFNNLQLEELLDTDLVINYDNFYKEDLINMNLLLRKQNKEQEELLDNIYKHCKNVIIDYGKEHDCCVEEVSRFASDITNLFPKGDG